MTLVELLVVIAILAILLGAAVPLLSPASDSRRLREASRGLNTFISAAQTRATETGRPFGIALKKLSQDTNPDPVNNPIHEDNGVCVEAYYVEQPAPYAGFDGSSRVMLGMDAVPGPGGGDVVNPHQLLVRFVRVDNTTSPGEFRAPPGVTVDPLPFGLVRPNDLIKIGDHVFRFIDLANDGADLDKSGYYKSGIGDPPNSLFVTPSDVGALPLYTEFAGNPPPIFSAYRHQSGVSSLNFVYDGNGDRIVDLSDPPVPRFWTEPLRYKIIRQPIRTSNAPYQLPEGTAIDLEASGFANGAQLYAPNRYPPGSNPGANDPRGVPANANDVVVMFSPEGAIERVHNVAAANGQPIAESLVSTNLYLLVGLRENIPAPETDFAAVSGTDAEIQEEKAAINWLNGDARWVTVGAQTGAVVTAENAFVDPQQIATMELPPEGDPDRYVQLVERRENEIKAARDIARQMSGIGGR